MIPGDASILGIVVIHPDPDDAFGIYRDIVHENVI